MRQKGQGAAEYSHMSYTSDPSILVGGLAMYRSGDASRTFCIQRCMKVWQKGINIEDNEEECLAETKTYDE